nr:MAG TPA: hypothetical protein [Caudoviricetes sp.]
MLSYFKNKKFPTLSDRQVFECEVFSIVKGIKKPSLLYPFYQEMR